MTRLFNNQIMDHLVGLINTNLSTELGLKVVSKGNLTSLPAPQDLENWLNAVLIEPKNHIIEKIAQGVIDVTYNFRILFLRKRADGEEYLATDVEKAEKISELLLDNYTLGSLGIPEISCESCLPKRTDYESEEQALFDGLELNIGVVATEVEVKTCTHIF